MVRLLARAALFVAATLLGGCGGSQPLIGNPAAMPQGDAITSKAAHSKSWMLPEAKKEDLLYVADSFCGCLRVFSYPKGKPVGVLTDVASELEGECSDAAGNVWVTSFGFSEVVEFAHGGARPIARLYEDRNTDAWGCSVDPVTGNLAVKNNNDTVAVFAQARGNPTIYSGDFNDCAYDSEGNLFCDDNASPGLFELPRSGNTLTQVTMSKTIGGESIQWDGENLAIVSDRVKGSKLPLVVYRVHVSGTTGTVISQAILRGRHDEGTIGKQFWIQGNTIIGQGPVVNDQTSLLNFWHYPDGKAKKSISVTEYPGIGPPGMYGFTVSIAPK